MMIQQLKALGRFVGIIAALPALVFGTGIAARAGVGEPLLVGVLVMLLCAAVAVACTSERPIEASMDHRW